MLDEGGRRRAPRRPAGPRDYGVDHNVRVLRDNFAERLPQALRPEPFAAIVSDPEQPSLFDESLAEASTILTRHG